VRFLHTADWHIGSGRSKLPDGEYLNRQMTALRELVSVAEQFADGVILVSGDIFDRKLVLEPERNAFLTLIDQGVCDGITWLIANGNHDITEDGLTNLRTLSIMARNMKNVHVAELYPKLVVVKGTTFLLYPPWERGSLDSADAQDEINRFLVKKDCSGVVVSTHFSVSGSLTETGYKMQSGTALRGSKRVAYWALGDIHRCQQVAKNAWYSGNPLDHRWGEKGAKGCLIVDTDRDKPTFHELKEAPRLKVISRLPEKQPGNALCKLVAPMREMPLTLPDWVIATEVVSEKMELVAQEVVKQAALEKDPLVGIRTILSQYDLEAKEVEWCESHIRSALQTLR
jgi:DNA repair exonuclease SbcCD nuclease subunit